MNSENVPQFCLFCKTKRPEGLGVAPASLLRGGCRAGYCDESFAALPMAPVSPPSRLDGLSTETNGIVELLQIEG